MKNIPVRRGWELLIPLNMVGTAMLYSSIEDNALLGIVVSTLFWIGINLLLFGIKYYINPENELCIKNSIFGTQKVMISHIYQIGKTWIPISSPAPGIFGRVEIYASGGIYIIISPKNYNEFKALLLEINPNIKITL